jgi:hypothetical protein
MPTTDEIANDLNGSVLFSQLDLNKAFHQIVVDRESRDLSVFVTHRGYFHYTRLHMGIKPASQILIHILQNNVLNGVIGARVIADNILVFGKSTKEHDTRLLKVCERLKEKGLTVSRGNCTLGVTELEFFGLRISKDGVATGWGKMESITKAARPADVSQLRSFLGIATYCAPNIPTQSTASLNKYIQNKYNAVLFKFKD